jgi:magnesium transporter
MTRLARGRSRKFSLPPGTMVHIGEKTTEAPKITVMEYDEAGCREKEAPTIEAALPLKGKPAETWINVSGLNHLEVIENVGRQFNLHPLVLEDIVNTEQRPKMEDFGDYLFIVLKLVSYDDKTGELKMDQISLILLENAVISFTENGQEFFNPVRERIRNGKGRIRKMGADYLTYVLIDTVVDHYFLVLENLGERIEFLEEELIKTPASETLQMIHQLKRDMIFVRKSIWPIREVVNGLERSGTDLIEDPVLFYLRDVYDHAVQIIDTIETLRDMLSGMLDIYLSSISNRINEVMKVLTIIATIFIPLTFIAGVYGMNFKHMPELEWRYGYFVVVSGMVAIGITMLLAFKRKKWF